MISLLGTLRPGMRARSVETGRCTVDGCEQVTHARKPYCIDHLDRLPYVRWLQEELGRRSESASPSTVVDQDIVRQLSLHGPLTIPRLAREAEVSASALEARLKSLEKAGLVRTQVIRDRRGHTRRFASLDEPRRELTRRVG